jgi:hypothetical protein
MATDRSTTPCVRPSDEQLDAAQPEGGTTSEQAILRLELIIAANKLAWDKRSAGFKGDMYWQGVDSHIDAAEEWLSSLQPQNGRS